MPSVAVQVFGKCMVDNGRNMDDPEYEVSLLLSDDVFGGNPARSRWQLTITLHTF